MVDLPEGAVSNQSPHEMTFHGKSTIANRMGMIKLSHPYRLSEPLLRGCRGLCLRRPIGASDALQFRGCVVAELQAPGFESSSVVF
jgi:hypothetical protein